MSWYFYDILIYSSTIEFHVQHLTQVLKVLQENKLKVYKKKCSFSQTSLYIGVILYQAADPKKVEAMWEWPIPKDVTALRGFLGLMGYSGRGPQAFGTLKETFSRSPMLAVPKVYVGDGFF